MDRITAEVAVGNYREAQDPALLQGHGIRSVLCLDGSLTPGQAAGLAIDEVASYRLIDGPGNDARLPVRRRGPHPAGEDEAAGPRAFVTRAGAARPPPWPAT